MSKLFNRKTVTAAVLSGCGAIGSPMAAAEFLGERLFAGDVMLVGDYIRSENGRFFSVLQPDGRLVVYRGLDPATNHGYFGATNPPAHYDSYFATVQIDGNFVIYRGEGPHSNRGHAFDTQTSGEDVELMLRGDGRLALTGESEGFEECGADPLWLMPGDARNKGAVLHAGESLRSGERLSAPNGEAFLIMQPDGNLVLYRGSGPSDNVSYVWSSGTSVRGGATPSAWLLRNGQLVIFGVSAFPFFVNDAPSVGEEFHLDLTDGDALIYASADACDPDRIAVWRLGDD